MKLVKPLLFAAAVVICFSITGLAQNQDPKKVPPKGTPPIIVVPTPNKDKDKDKPKNDNKKPGMAYLRQRNEDQAEIV